MKKLYALSTLLFIAFAATAQAPSYVDFEWDVVNLGYTFSTAEASSAGSFSSTEVRYNATDNFALGLGFGSINTLNEPEGSDFELFERYSTIVGEYYLKGNSGQRPFAGIGVGLNFLTTTFVNGDLIDNSDTSTSSLFAPRIGYEFNHIRLTAQYGIAPKENHNNFFSLSVGLTLWGGYKGKEFN